MQGLHTSTAMNHAGLSLATVWDHFLNMGGGIGYLEVDAYLHGVMPLPVADRDWIAQAVNELLDDLARAGYHSCCRAPYSDAGTSSASERAPWQCFCTAVGSGRAVAAPEGRGRATATAGRRVPRPSPLQPVRQSARRER